VVAGSEPTAALGAAVRRGIHRLEALAPAGQWAGFPTLAGCSDVWVTAFTVAHLKTLGPRARCLERARRFLARQQQASGGWGYGGTGVPADADSTAWCLGALGRSPALTRRRRATAAAFLDAHRLDRGFRTYLPDSGIHRFIQAQPDVSIAGWTSVHDDVTAAVLAANTPPRDARDSRILLGRLVGSQTAAGLIPAYWWRSPWYTLVLTLRALRVHRWRPTRQFVRLALEALDGKRLAHGGYGLGADPSLDPFTTALALEAYLHLAGATQRSVSTVATALLGAQRPDGGWEGGFVLRIPAPGVVDPSSVSGWRPGAGGGNAFVKDDNGIFATVLACHALELYRRVRRGAYAGLGKAWPQLVPGAHHDDGIATVAVSNPPEAERCNVQDAVPSV